MVNKYLQWLAVGLLGAITAIASIKLEKKYQQQPQPKNIIQEKEQPKVVAPILPKLPKITTALPNYQTYPQIVEQLKQWNQEAIDFTNVKTYGKSNKINDLYYIQLTNKLNSNPKRKILIHACIHGNEPLSTSCIMGYIGNLLDSYGKDPKITDILDRRDLYFVPVVCPDSYPNSRFIDGVDPNRDFPTINNHKTSTACVEAIKNFYLDVKPHAVMSGHTFGRVYLYPYGYTYNKCPHDTEYRKILTKMCELSGYKMMRACEIYSQPISGGELDWYYTQGVDITFKNKQMDYRGAFTIVCEFGTHQNIPSQKDIKTEYDMTWESFLYFLQEAPKIDILWNGNYKNHIYTLDIYEDYNGRKSNKFR